jgi:hypothetical protein
MLEQSSSHPNWTPAVSAASSGHSDDEGAALEDGETDMWTHEASIETTATPAQIWKLFSNVAGWKEWNAGIEKIEIDGPFAEGTTFSMQVPGGDTFRSRLIDVNEDEGFTDETVVDATRVVVHHKLVHLSSGRTRVTNSTVVTGPAAAEVGPLVTGDFQAVLTALRNLAESR